MWIIVLVVLLFLVMGIFLLLGKGSWLISGYNTASKEEKNKYNEKKLCHTMGIMCLAIAMIIALMGVINTEAFATIMVFPLVAVIVVSLVYANTRCKK